MTWIGDFLTRPSLGCYYSSVVIFRLSYMWVYIQILRDFNLTLVT